MTKRQRLRYSVRDTGKQKRERQRSRQIKNHIEITKKKQTNKRVSNK